MAVEQPWMYNAEQRDNSRFPATTFDPKAVTRASWEPKPPRAKQEGPLISFNRHPDAQMVLTHRTNPYIPMNPRTKKWIQWLRRVQLGLRVVELNGAVGILALVVLLTKMDPVKGWVMRIVPSVVICHCIYAIYHLSRDAGGRTPTSSAAYQVFSAVADFTALGLYAFGALTTHNESDGWSTRIAGREDLTKIFVPAVYYAMVVVGGLHVVSLSLSFWLAWAFRKISLMPPDMNPLEDNLTARPRHKRNKSSMTTLTSTESEKRLSTPLGSGPRSEMSYGDTSRPPTVPFMHTREGSSVSLGSRDSRRDLPTRQYQVLPGNSPRNSAMSVEPKRMSRPMSAYRGTYAEVPLDEPNAMDDKAGSLGGADNARVGKFTETWMPTDSLVSRTNQRNRNAAAALRASKQNSPSYAALSQRYDLEESSDSEYENENVVVAGDQDGGLSEDHPNPLRSNPLQASRTITNRAQTPFYPQSSAEAASDNALSEINPNSRHVSGSKDIADENIAISSKGWQNRRNTSIQPDSGFYSKPYGELKSATPPIIVGGDRKVSSGNDYDSKYSSTACERRNVSGKVAEEGRAANRASHYGFYMSRGY